MVVNASININTSGIKFKHDIYMDRMLIKIQPGVKVDTIVIPDKKELTTIKSIEVEPVELAKSIKHLILPKTLKVFNGFALRRFENLETLYIPADLISYEGSSESNSLKSVTIKSLGYNSEIFRNNTRLENVKFEKQPVFYGNSTFERCRHLRVDGLLNEGLLAIHDRAFDNWGLTNVTLPKSLKRLSVAAFSNCRYLSTLRITGNTLVISRTHTGVWDDGIGDKLLSETDRAKVYCPYDYPYKYIEKLVGNHIMVVRDKPNGKDISEQDLIAKATMLGLELYPYNIAQNKKSVTDTLYVLNESVLKRQIAECINAMVLESISDMYGLVYTSYPNIDREYLIGGKGLFVKLNIPFNSDWFNKLKNAYIGKKHAILIFEDAVVVYALDKERLIKSSKEPVYMGNRQGIVTLPMAIHEINYKEVNDITENNNIVIIKTVDKEIRLDICKEYIV